LPRTLHRTSRRTAPFQVLELLQDDFASLKRSEGPENCPEYDDAVVLDLMADLVFAEPDAQRRGESEEGGGDGPAAKKAKSTR